MATLYISEFARLGQDLRSVVMAPEEPVLANQTVTIGVGSAASAAFNASTTFVEIHADAICSIKFGTAPTAAATDMRLAAGDRIIRAVPRGASYKVACIVNT